MQRTAIYLVLIPAITLSICLNGCKSHEPHIENGTKFTKADSVTEKYLDLEDSILIVWNTIVNDDNLKIQTMHDLLHQLLVSNTLDKDELISLENRLNELDGMKITQESIKDPIHVYEYDLASKTLVNELINLTSSVEPFKKDPLQIILATIQDADSRVRENRFNYDKIAYEFNQFVERNEAFLNEQDQNLSTAKKGLFQISSESQGSPATSAFQN
ncbi:MAG TPA: hypothetical protein VFW11_09565 [Cyclobacteriaceae bacterium]|nr:hypothetical protein [Cyclobacteriaceae bacterium]